MATKTLCQIHTHMQKQLDSLQDIIKSIKPPKPMTKILSRIIIYEHLYKIVKNKTFNYLKKTLLLEKTLFIKKRLKNYLEKFIQVKTFLCYLKC